MTPKRSKRISLLALLWLLSACDPVSETTEPTEATSAIVNVKTLATEPISLEQPFPGRVAAFRVAQIRPQVSGIVTEMKFNPGSELHPGQALFQIDPAPFKADVNSAAASLQKAQASHRQLQSRAKRLAKLIHMGAVSQQEYEDAVSAAEQAKADVAETRATLERKQLDLAYSTVKSPIGGRIDQNFITEGALVSADDSLILATVQQIDKVYVDVRQPATKPGTLHAIAGTFPPDENTVTAEILSADGVAYSNKTQILFTGVNVDTGTGDVILRLLVDNPERTLLPGMYVQAKVSRLLTHHGLLIPREAVMREGNSTHVWLNDGGKAKSVEVELGAAIGANFAITNGLKAGDRLVITGMGRLREGTPLQLAQGSQQ